MSPPSRHATLAGACAVLLTSWLLATSAVTGLAHIPGATGDSGVAQAPTPRQPTVTPGGPGAGPCGKPNTGLIPLTDLGAGSYLGTQGGLYPGGSNVPPPAYLASGLAMAQTIQPINGKIVILSQGFSNTHQEFPRFQQQAAADSSVNPAIVTVDGAQGGMDALIWSDPNHEAWDVAEANLVAAGVTRQDVQVLWFKTTRVGENQPHPVYAERVQNWTREWILNQEAAYPNLKLIYISSRTYGGNWLVPINPEPQAYQTGFAVKWLIEERMAGAVPMRAHVQWGPYLWADDEHPRNDGLTWPCADYDKDGVHPGPNMEVKVGTILLNFFKTDPTTKTWFLASGPPPPTMTPGGSTSTPVPPTATLLPPTATTTAVPPRSTPTTATAPPTATKTTSRATPTPTRGH